MSRIPGEKKEKITFTCDIGNSRRMDMAIQNNEFSSVSEVINKAITYFFENRNSQSPKDEVKQWLVSEDGETFMKGLILKVKSDK